MATSTCPRIYVASLSDYNAGVLHGVWINLDGIDAEEVQEIVNKMLAESPTAKREGTPAEEWAIHDDEGFYDIEISEDATFEEVCEHAEMIEGNGLPWSAYVNNVGRKYANVEDFEESYQGHYDSVEAYAEQLLEDCGMMGGLPEWARPYFDMEQYAKDLELNGDIWTHEDCEGVHVFRNL